MSSTDALIKLLSLKGKVALITGAEKGIGHAVAYRFAQAGAHLHLLGLDAKALEAVAGTLQSDFGVIVSWEALDLSDPHAATPAFERAMGIHRHVDVLVNNAGIFPAVSVLDITDQAWDGLMALNLRAAFVLSRELARHALASGSAACIVNMLSVSALRSAGNAAHYVSSKHALAGLTKAMAVELGPAGVRVLGVAPGLIRTEGVQAWCDGAPDVAKELADYELALPLGRGGHPDEVATVTLFAASAMASYMTGEILVVDGGDTAR